MSRPITPTKEQIRAWIDNSDLEAYIVDSIAPDYYDMLKDTSFIEEIQDKIDDLIETAYEQGADDKEIEDIEELPDNIKEEIGCTFTIQKFAECRTLEDFKRELAWIESQSLTYMK